VTIYQIVLRDRETQTVVGYYNGAWTTDRRRALAFRRREAAEAHAARMRDRCPRNAELSRRSLSPTSTKRGNAPRAATVRAKDRVIALRIPKEPFMRMVREFPTVAVSIMQELAQRLAEVTELAVSTDGTKPGSR